MLKVIQRIFAFVLLPVCAGCASGMTVVQGKGLPAMNDGIAYFENGNYDKSQKALQIALEQGLTLKADQAKAHKYLAFDACVTSRETVCREEFKKALEADQYFDLSPAEAGHPIWGPVFRSVKGKK